jgi:hypothetical protein
MTRVGNDMEGGFRPSTVEIPCGFRRANHVIAALYNLRRYVANTVYVIE